MKKMILLLLMLIVFSSLTSAYTVYYSYDSNPSTMSLGNETFYYANFDEYCVLYNLYLAEDVYIPPVYDTVYYEMSEWNNETNSTDEWVEENTYVITEGYYTKTSCNNNLFEKSINLSVEATLNDIKIVRNNDLEVDGNVVAEGFVEAGLFLDHTKANPIKEKGENTIALRKISDDGVSINHSSYPAWLIIDDKRDVAGTVTFLLDVIKEQDERITELEGLLNVSYIPKKDRPTYYCSIEDKVLECPEGVSGGKGTRCYQIFLVYWDYCSSGWELI